MKTNTSKIKKLVLGLLVVGFALGTSAFTNVRVNYNFYRTSGPINSTNPNDYEYIPGASCLQNENQNCRVVEDLPTEPAEGAHPSTSAMSTIVKGQVQLP